MVTRSLVALVLALGLQGCASHAVTVQGLVVEATPEVPHRFYAVDEECRALEDDWLGGGGRALSRLDSLPVVRGAEVTVTLWNDDEVVRVLKVTGAGTDKPKAAEVTPVVEDTASRVDHGHRRFVGSLLGAAFAVHASGRQVGIPWGPSVTHTTVKIEATGRRTIERRFEGSHVNVSFVVALGGE